MTAPKLTVGCGYSFCIGFNHLAPSWADRWDLTSLDPNYSPLCAVFYNAIF